METDKRRVPLGKEGELMSDTAVWTGKTQLGASPDWAGDGTCTVLDGDHKRQGFDGPAVHVQFHTPGKWKMWVDADQLVDA